MESDKKNTQEVAVKNHDIISFFEKDAGFVFAFKKTEKLASAIYLITNLFDNTEPLKWTLRKKASELLSFTLLYKDIVNSSMSDFLYNAKTNVLEIVSLLEVAMMGGLVSHMNFTIIKDEFSNLLDVLNSGSSAHRETARESITSQYFNVPEIPGTFKQDGNAKYAPVADVQASTFRMSHSLIKDNHTQIIGKDELKRSNRQNTILSLIKKKKEVTIKDIAVVIKDCSEKTIQRELNTFISLGVLKRSGERRWSKYSLA